MILIKERFNNKLEDLISSVFYTQEMRKELEKISKATLQLQDLIMYPKITRLVEFILQLFNEKIDSCEDEILWRLLSSRDTDELSNDLKADIIKIIKNKIKEEKCIV